MAQSPDDGAITAPATETNDWGDGVTGDEATGDEATAGEPASARIPDELGLAVPRGSRVLVFSGLRLTAGGTDATREVTRTVARALEDFRGPAVLVLAGDTFDLLRDARPDPDAALAAHARFRAALGTFLACAERRVVVLPGTRDAALAYDARALAMVRVAGWEPALRCQLEIDTGCGLRIVRVEPGHDLDPAAAFSDPRDPNDHSLVQHLEREVLPALSASGGAKQRWLEGIDDADPADMGGLIASRFAYRRLFRRATWLTLPVLALLALFFPIAAVSSRRTHALDHLFRLLAAGFLIELILVAVVLMFMIVQLRDSLGAMSWLSRSPRRERRGTRRRRRSGGRRRRGPDHRVHGQGGADRSRRWRLLRELRRRGARRRAARDARRPAGGVCGPVAMLVGRARSRRRAAREVVARRARPARSHPARTCGDSRTVARGMAAGRGRARIRARDLALGR